ncbi:MAG: gephyrin-like molybdotransferase Glp [Pseudomonadota bacterium]
MRPAPATPVADAIDRLVAACSPVNETESVPLGEALKRPLAADFRAPFDLPAADDSAMDGYAVRHAELGDAAALPVSERVTAGQMPQPLPPGHAARIFTGATIPAGADTVVRQEDCEATDGAVLVHRNPARGANIRPAGQDVRHGEPILAAGTRLGPAELGLLASLGVAEVRLRRRLAVGILSTGEELVPPGSPAAPGQRHDANSALLCGLVGAWGMRARPLGIIGDDREAIGTALVEAARSCDFLLVSGGASVGEEDHVRGAVGANGEVSLWRVAIKPGKPLLFGQVSGTPLLGLPGNPGAALITALILGRPALFARQGAGDGLLAPIPTPAGFSAGPDSRTVYVRCRMTAGRAVPLAVQSSGTLASATRADGFAVIRPGTGIEPGETVGFLPGALLWG